MLKRTVEYDEEDLKVVVNDQKLNISVLDYIEIKSKYEMYLKAIRFLGNFATFEHIETIFKELYSETKVFNDLKRMCSMHLLRKEVLGKYVYFVLTKKAQIYLKQRNNVGYIQNPSDKALKSNLLLVDYIINNRIDIKTDKVNSSDNKTIMLISDFKNYTDYIRNCCINLYREMIRVKEVEKKFLSEQINLITKKSEFIESNGKLRFVRHYDVLRKLMLKNIYLINVESNSDDIIITFLIQDIDRSVSWYKNEILNIESILKEFYFNPIKKLIKYNLIIQTDSIENKKNLSKIQEVVKSLKRSIEKYIRDMLSQGFSERTLIDNYLIGLEKKIWALNDISVVEYNTVRFFETRSDKINTIDNTQINVVDISLNKGDKVYGR